MQQGKSLPESNGSSGGDFGNISAPILSAMVGGLIQRALSFAAADSGPGDIHAAWRAFRVWLSPWMDLNAKDWPLFLQWYVFHWRSQDEAGALDQSIAERFVRDCAAELTCDECLLLIAGSRTPPDFYEILTLTEPNCFYVKSLLLGAQSSFAFDLLPEELSSGDIFFGKILHVRDDRGVILAHSSPLARAGKFSISKMRLQLVGRRRADFLGDFSLFEPDILNLYHDILQSERAPD